MRIIIRIIFAYFRSLLQSWLPLPRTLYILLNSKARRSATYIDACYGSIAVGLKFSFIPFRYNEKSNKISVKPQSALISNFHFFLHVTWCILQACMGIHWYTVRARRDRLDPVLKKDILWQRIVYFYYPSLATGTIPIIWLMRKRADQLKPLITTPFHMEQWCVNYGIKGYVQKYLLGVATFVYTSCLLLPFIYFAASVLRPCLPFVVVSLVTEDCHGWYTPGTVSLAAKVFFGMFDFYAWVFLPGVYLGIGWMEIVYPGSASTRKIEAIMR